LLEKESCFKKIIFVRGNFWRIRQNANRRNKLIILRAFIFKFWFYQ